MKKSSKYLAVAFALIALVLIASISFIYIMGLAAIDARQKVESKAFVLRHLEEFVSALKDTETGQRGYVITGQESYLAPYQEGLTNFNAEMQVLRQLVTNGNLTASSVDALAGLSQEKLSELAETIALRRDKGVYAATNEVATGRGKGFMDKIRAQASLMEAGEQQKLSEAGRSADHAMTLCTIASALVGALSLGFIGLSFRRIYGEITRREAMSLEIAQQKEILHTTLSSIGDGVIVTDPQGRVTFLNAEAEKLTGWKSPEAAGQSLPKVFPIINETSRLPVENPVDKVLKLGGVVGLANHTLLLAKDGREIPIDDSAAPIRMADGPLFGVVLVFRDFSEHKRMEKEMLEANARLETTVQERTAKLREMIAELEHVSYAIVHDMRSPLRAMTGFASILADEGETTPPAERRKYADRIMTAAMRLDQLIQDALAYNKAVLQELPMHPVDLSKLVPSVVEIYPNLHPEKADIRVDALPVVMGNEALLTQCFSNLLGNAVKFVTPGSKPRIRIWREGVDDEAVIWVEDNGIGIPLEARSKLFGMFQKLNTTYEGSGIGLAIVRKVVERMGGKVGVESEPGKGSRFWLKLRRAK